MLLDSLRRSRERAFDQFFCGSGFDSVRQELHANVGFTGRFADVGVTGGLTYLGPAIAEFADVGCPDLEFSGLELSFVEFSDMVLEFPKLEFSDMVLEFQNVELQNLEFQKLEF